MDIALIISVLLKQAPYLMFSLLGLGMVLIGSTGKFIKAEIDPKDRPVLKKTGWAIFWLFLIAALFEIVAPGKLKEFISLLPVLLFSTSTLLILLGLGLCILFVYYGVPHIQKIRTEKGYKIETEKVLDNPFSNGSKKLHRQAGILVENTGNGELRLVAKLVKIAKKDNKNNYVPIEIKEVNPKGYYLRWNDGSNGCILTKQRPRNIDFVSAYEERDFFRQGSILFEKGYKKPIETGLYSVQIDIFSVQEGRHTTIKTINGVLALLLYFKSSPSSIYGDGIHVEWKDGVA